jgi:hypothetical protein
MMAWILVSLLASYVGDAVVAFSPESYAPSNLADDGSGLPPKPTGFADDGSGLPPKP